jgi:hypothetical protein
MPSGAGGEAVAAPFYRVPLARCSLAVIFFLHEHTLTTLCYMQNKLHVPYFAL